MAVRKAIPSVREIIAASLLISTVVSPLASFAGKKNAPVEVIPVNDMARKIEASQRASAARAQDSHASTPNLVGKEPVDATSETSTENKSAASTSTTSAANQKTAVPVQSEATNPSVDRSESEQASDDAPRDVAKEASAVSEAKILKGSVTHSTAESPLMYDKIQEVPQGTSVNLVSLVNINSDFNRKGDEIWMRVGNDVHGPSEVAVPGGWYMHGVVTEAENAKRVGRNGFITIQFDKLVSPDKQFEVPIDAHATSKQSTGKMIVEHIAKDSVHIGYGAVGGSILSVQMTGIGTAIATHGISVGVGAGIGATVGLVGALKRKGTISQITPGDDMKLTFTEPISLPGFNSKLIPSAKPQAKLENFDVRITKFEFRKDPNGDRNASRLAVAMTVNNHTKDEYGFAQMAVVSDRGETYFPNPLANNVNTLFKNRIKPDGSGSAIVVYDVAGKQRKYWLVLINHATQAELNRVPIN